MSPERNGDWLDEFGCCKLCDGEIPYGHTSECHLWKLEQQITTLESRVQELDKLNRDAQFLVAKQAEMIHRQESKPCAPST